MTTMTFTTATRPAFSGCYTALITPFRNGELDIPALRTLVERQILGGVAGLVPCGTTGETPALTTREWETVVTTVVETTHGRVPVIAGTGSNGTASTIERTQRAQELGADAALVVTPYYNKPTQEGLYRHFCAIAEETDLPVMLYNVPGRTGVNMTVETVLRLAEIENIVALKEAGGSLDDRLSRGPLALPLAARMLGQIASALTFAHEQGIVHRDLKPNNVLLDERDNAYLTDFGIAKMLAGTTKLTATGNILGTPAYMAPEQWRGELVDARTDIYSLGIMLYEMVIGQLPFSGDTPYTLMYKHFNDAPPPPRPPVAVATTGEPKSRLSTSTSCHARL